MPKIQPDQQRLANPPTRAPMPAIGAYTKKFRERNMAAYALIELEVTHMEGIAPYMAAVADTVAKHGGKYLVRGGNTEIVEGGLGYPVKVVLEFPSMDAAKNWYGSAEYQAILPMRKANATGNFVWAEGV